MDFSLASVLRIITQLLALIPLVTTIVYFWHNALIPELAYDFCSRNDLAELADSLDKNANDVVFVNFKHNRQHCFYFDDVSHIWHNTNYRNPRALAFDTSAQDRILFRFPYAWSSATANQQWLTSDPSFKINLFKGTAYNPYNVERDVESTDTLDIQGIYFVEKASGERSYSRVFNLRPVPYSDELVSHMKCLYRD